MNNELPKTKVDERTEAEEIVLSELIYLWKFLKANKLQNHSVYSILTNIYLEKLCKILYNKVSNIIVAPLKS